MNTFPALIVFDLYGTLVQFGIKHHPFRKILLWAREQGRSPKPDDARKLMTVDKDCGELLATLGIFPPANMLTQLHQEIQEELAGLTLFDDVLPTLDFLTSRGVPLAICSNLAKPYGAVIDQLLPQFNFTRHLSYEIGAIKPDIEMYESILTDTGLIPEQILFIGDTSLADYEGPTKFGFRAKHLVRGQSSGMNSIALLTEVLQLLALDS
ncbi:MULTISPECIES: HAD family hydrolase [unclassified Cellvibrio]|uniref:HAD family hydrolase n=1 Tax=unclassified Cellvibrio TaxID=2624793 RepID=UPI0005900F45|nr:MULTISPECIES: HAD-IA family hydrolase [unclassified Cellvibrio]UUA73775.1 HAD-IA family hydrolase [Cellvibrio sp. QJXJ]